MLTTTLIKNVVPSNLSFFSSFAVRSSITIIHRTLINKHFNDMHSFNNFMSYNLLLKKSNKFKQKNNLSIIYTLR